MSKVPTSCIESVIFRDSSLDIFGSGEQGDTEDGDDGDQ